VETAVATLLEAAEQPEVARWIEFPNSVLLFTVVSGNPQSGAIYWLDRKKGTWYSIDFDDQGNTAAITSISLRLFSNNAVSLA
jgi:hypothetical protein